MLEEELARKDAPIGLEKEHLDQESQGSFNVPKDKEQNQEEIDNYDLDLDVFEVDEYE
ncbi:hypothetical protein D3C86_1653620 [compost metagenome]